MVSPRNIRLVLALLVVTAIIGIVSAIFVKSSHKSPSESVSKQLPQNIDVVLHNAHFSEMRDGVNVWELVAETAEYDKTGEVAYLNAVHMEFVKTQAHGTIIVTSNKGEYSNKTRNVRLRGKVHVVTESGMVFDTESLDYVAASSQFRTSERVDFHHERLSLAAIGMELNVNDEKAKFFKAVDAVVEGVKPQ